jgi:type IV pilus assembly protein PilV
MNKRSSQQYGFSLLELLVALVVFSLGLLAVAGLQTVSKQANYEGLQRTTASQIAQGLLADMRTNSDAIDIYRTAGEIGGGSRGAEPAPNCRFGAECNAAEKAVYDLWFWEQAIDGSWHRWPRITDPVYRRTGRRRCRCLPGLDRMAGHGVDDQQCQ